MVEMQLYSHARKFVDAFFAPGAPRVQLLVAPPQVGAGAVIVAAALRAAGTSGRALIVVPTLALGEQFERRLRDAAERDLQISFVYGAGFRERAATTEGAVFDQPGIYIVSVMLALGPALDAVLSTHWSLVAFDSVAMGAGRSSALVSLLKSPRVARVLVRSDGGQPTAVMNFPTTVWRVVDLLDAEGRRLLRDVRTRVVDYRSSAEEAALYHDVVAAAATLAWSRPLVRAASSSPAALEEVLDRRGAADDDDGGTASSSDPQQARVDEPSAALDSLLARLDELDRDSKLDAAVDTVSSALKEGPRVVVLTAYIATARYLHAAFTERGLDVVRMSSDVRLEDLDAPLQGFSEQGGVLVATVATLRGRELPDVAMVLHYDRPASLAEHDVRISRFRRGNVARPLDSVFLRDLSNAAPDEGPVPELADSNVPAPKA